MSESTPDDSDLNIVQNPKNNSLFSSSIKKIIIIAKKNKKYFFPKIPHFTKAEKIKEGLILFLAVISYFLYYLSLGGCDGTQTECLKNSNIAYYYMLVNYCFISAGLTAFIVFLMAYRRITKLHLIHQIIVFLILFLSDTGSTLMHHGIYNIFGFLLFLIFYSIFLLAVVKIEDILLQKSLPIKLVVINIIILLVIFGRYAFHEALKRECKDWDLGLNNTRIEDDINKYPCQIFRPISCHINFFSKKQDLSRLLKLDCSNNVNSNQAINARNQLIKYINKKEFENTTRFGFPLTNRPKFIITPDLTPNTFTQKVYDNIIDMDNKNYTILPDEYPEITLTFEQIDKDNKKGDNSMKYMGKININLTKNEALSASRKKMETPDTLFNNIIMIYTDAVSRAHFKRNMPKTCAFIEKFMKNNFDNDFKEYKKKVINIRKTNSNKNNLIEHIPIKGRKTFLNQSNKNIINKSNIIITNKTTQILKNSNIINKKNKVLSKVSLKKKLRKKIIKNRNASFNQTIFKNQINNTGINITFKKPTRKLEAINITNYFENKYYAYQFLKYHTFNSGTKFNAMPMFYGTTVFNPIGTNIIKYFKQLGYITAQSTDMCSKEVWEPEKEPQNLDFDSWDHENVAMFCDPSYMDRKSLYSIYKGVYSLLRRCFYGKEVHDYIFEYGKQFWEAYPDNKKFLRLGFNDGHESTFEVLKYLDEPLEQFLQYFLEKGYLKNTALFIISDHGNHMPGIYNLFFSQQFETERVLANFYLIFNSGNLFGDKLNMFRLFNLNALENQQSLITPYDIHDTLMHMIYGNHINKFFSNKGKSVFWKIDNSGRTCDFFDQDDEEKGLCRCVLNSKYEKFVYYDYNK